MLDTNLMVAVYHPSLVMEMRNEFLDGHCDAGYGSKYRVWYQMVIC